MKQNMRVNNFSSTTNSKPQINNHYHVENSSQKHLNEFFMVILAFGIALGMLTRQVVTIKLESKILQKTVG